jgi:hypothetical protein
MITLQRPVTFDARKRTLVFDTTSQKRETIPQTDAEQFCVFSRRYPETVTLAPAYDVFGCTVSNTGYFVKQKFELFEINQSSNWG